MSRSVVLRLVAITFGVFFAGDLCAATVDQFGAAEIMAEGNKLVGFFFGPCTYVAAVFGSIWGVIQAIMKSSVMPVLFFGGISLTVGFLPKLISGVFGASGMLLP
jgi:hypothetical protein